MKSCKSFAGILKKYCSDYYDVIKKNFNFEAVLRNKFIISRQCLKIGKQKKVNLLTSLTAVGADSQFLKGPALFHRNLLVRPY